MIKVMIDGKEFPKEKILDWEKEKTEEMVYRFQKKIPSMMQVCDANAFAQWKAGVPEETIRKMIHKQNAVSDVCAALAADLSKGKRKISIAEIDVDFCDAKTLYKMFMDVALHNTEENRLCNLRANPQHFILKGIDTCTQEVIEISAGAPIPERFFIRYGDETGLVSKKENDYPFQASGVAFLENGKRIGGVRHQMKNTIPGCHVKLMVEFPGILPNVNVRAHQYHLACEFYNWFSEFERRLK